MTKPERGEKWEGTEEQKAYWKSMCDRKGEQTPRWKGSSASKTAKHQWLTKNIGRPTFCCNSECKHKSQLFEWCLKRDKIYSHNPDDYLWLCRSCHRKYDLTEAKKLKAMENLWWKTGIPSWK